MDKAAVRRLVLSRPVPDRLIEALAATPLISPDRINMWQRNGGRIGFRPSGSVYVTPPTLKLAPRQLGALRELARGKSVGVIARELGVARQSVTNSLTEARFRLGAETIGQAILVAAARGYIELPNERQALGRLAASERQALAMFYEGAAKGEIARAMDVAPDTAAGYLKRARRRLGASTTAEAARLAFG